MVLNWVVFIIALSFMMGGSNQLSHALDRLGSRLPISPGLMGLITALGADSPEIASAVTALMQHEQEVGTGVVLGSNLFNIAALLGMGGVLAGTLPIQRGPLLFNGVTSLLITGAAALLVFHVLTPAWTMALLGAIFVPYIFISWLRPQQVEKFQDRGGAAKWLYLAVETTHRKPRAGKVHGKPWSDLRLTLTIIFSLLAIVGGAVESVNKALAIGTALGIPRGVIGSLVLAVLSSLPNAYTSGHLARQKEGMAVTSETINSNTINIVVGLGLPAILFTASTQKPAAVLEIWWLLGMTLAALLLPLPKRGLGRLRGGLLIAAYLAFVVARILMA